MASLYSRAWFDVLTLRDFPSAVLPRIVDIDPDSLIWHLPAPENDATIDAFESGEMVPTKQYIHDIYEQSKVKSQEGFTAVSFRLQGPKSSDIKWSLVKIRIANEYAAYVLQRGNARSLVRMLEGYEMVRVVRAAHERCMDKAIFVSRGVGLRSISLIDLRVFGNTEWLTDTVIDFYVSSVRNIQRPGLFIMPAGFNRELAVLLSTRAKFSMEDDSPRPFSEQLRSMTAQNCRHVGWIHHESAHWTAILVDLVQGTLSYANAFGIKHPSQADLHMIEWWLGRKLSPGQLLDTGIQEDSWSCGLYSVNSLIRGCQRLNGERLDMLYEHTRIEAHRVVMLAQIMYHLSEANEVSRLLYVLRPGVAETPGSQEIEILTVRTQNRLPALRIQNSVNDSMFSSAR
ncbi:hypothetical protein V8E36_002254 [Tilletia maclaganii]